MSGHSKWSQIKRQKGTNDQKRGQAFTKLGLAITLAVKNGGGIADPASNFKLRLAMEKAKASNMPKENIQRAIERAKGAEAGSLSEIMYEGFGPGGIALLVQTATDNRQRTVQEIKNIFESFGGSLGGPGATLHLFQNMGMISVVKSGKTTEEIVDKAIESGVEDFEEAGEEVMFYTKPENLHLIHEKLSQAGLTITESELIFKPVSTIPVASKEIAHKILSLMEKIEENDSVQHIFVNFDIPDEMF